MKILSAQQVREADAYTIENEPISSLNLMERAAQKCTNWITFKYESNVKFTVYAGLGNNGGDGLVIARLLHKKGYAVKCKIVQFTDKASSDFSTNYKRLSELAVDIKHINKVEDIAVDEPDEIIIDAIFGTGLSRPVEGIAAAVIKSINSQNNTVLAIDLPSGLFSESNADNIPEHIVLADITLTFQVPKLALFFPENGVRVGDWKIIDIGLDSGFIQSINTPYNLITESHIQGTLIKRYKYSHKGTYGHSLVVAGSYGKVGAAVLATSAALRAGSGLVTSFIPKCGYTILQTAVPEAMVITSEHESDITGKIDYSLYNAIGVGPGIGTNPDTQGMLKQLIQNTTVPLIIDADALNILAMNKTWISFLPKGSILTPHPGEFERLVGRIADDYARLQAQLEFSKRFGVYMILKGSNSIVTCPDGEVYFNSTGNPGMATAGSGDVLTGILTGLFAQGYDSKQTTIIGAYMHGLAGDIAAKDLSESSLIAGDIIFYLSKAIKTCQTTAS